MNDKNKVSIKFMRSVLNFNNYLITLENNFKDDMIGNYRDSIILQDTLISIIFFNLGKEFYSRAVNIHNDNNGDIERLSKLFFLEATMDYILTHNIRSVDALINTPYKMILTTVDDMVNDYYIDNWIPHDIIKEELNEYCSVIDIKDYRKYFNKVLIKSKDYIK